VPDHNSDHLQLILSRANYRKYVRSRWGSSCTDVCYHRWLHLHHLRIEDRCDRTWWVTWWVFLLLLFKRKKSKQKWRDMGIWTGTSIM